MNAEQYEVLIADELWAMNVPLTTILALYKSGACDDAFYLSKYPEVADTGLSPVEHYVLHGANEGKKPVWWFETNLYIEEYPDVAQDGINPFWHYLRYGKNEHRRLLFGNITEYIKFAEETMRQRDFEEALRRWAIVREKFPTHHSGYTRASTACLELAGWAQADALSKDAMEKVSGDIMSFYSHAEISMRQRDFDEALHRWAIVREKFPTYHHGYTRASTACLELADWAQAEAFSQKAMEKVPGDITSFISHAEVSMRQRYFDEALKRWAVVREKFPTHHSGYTRASTACLELAGWAQADALSKDAMEKVSGDIMSFYSHAEISMRQRGFEEALKRWAVVREKFPTHHHGYTRASTACLELADWAQAEAFSREAMEKVPGDITSFISHAEVAMRQRDFEEALARWAVVREKFQNHHAGYTRASTACLELSDWAQAEIFSKEATEKVPGDIMPFYSHAEVSMRQRDFDEALRRWAVVRENFPNHHHGYTRASTACLELADWAQAEAFSQKAMEKVPGDITSFINHAEVSMRQRNFEEALKCWAVVREKFPTHHQGYTRASTAYLELADWAQADAFSKQAIENVPGDIASFLSYAEASMRQRDFEEALKRWAVVREKFPPHHHGYTRTSAACLELADWAQAEAFSKAAMENVPGDIASFLSYAEVSLRQRDFNEALLRLEKLLNKFPNCSVGYAQKSTALIELKRFDEAEQIALFAQDKFWGDLLGYSVYAEIATSKGDWDVAVSRWQCFIKKFPSSNIGYSKISSIFLHLNNSVCAEQFSTHAAQYFPNDPSSLMIEAEFYVSIGRYDIAEHKFKSIIAKFQCHIAAHCRLAVIKSVLNDIIKIKQSAMLLRKAKAMSGRVCIPLLYKSAAEVLFHMSKAESQHNNLFKSAEFEIVCEILLNQPVKRTRDNLEILNSLFLIKRSGFEYTKTIKAINDVSEKFNISIDSFKPILKSVTTKEFEQYFFILMHYGNLTLLCRHIQLSILPSQEVELSLKSAINRFMQEGNWKVMNHDILFVVIQIMFVYCPDKINIFLDKILTYHGCSKYSISTPLGVLSFRTDFDRSVLLKPKNTDFSVMKKKLHVALCISGQLRGYGCAVQSWIKNLKLQKHDVEIFVHVWKNVGRKFPTKDHANRVFSHSFLDAYRKTVPSNQEQQFLKENYPNFSILLYGSLLASEDNVKQIINTPHVIIEDENNDPYRLFSNQEKMHYKIYACHNMAKLEHKKKSFDLFIRFRPDLFLTGEMRTDWEEIYTNSLKSHAIYTDGGISPRNSGVWASGDRVAVGIPELMEIYSRTYIDAQNVFWKQGAYGYPREYSGHNNITYQMFAHGITVLNLKVPIKMLDPQPLPIEQIYLALKKDIAMRNKTIFADDLLLNACLADMKNNNITC